MKTNMKMYIGFTRRNLLIFFKDKQSVIFSLMTSIIVFVLYLLFLKGTFTDAIDGSLKTVPAISGLVSAEDIDMYANLTLLVGILGSAMITVPFNCLMTIVRDRENSVDRDILATPIRRWQIILSYFTASALSAILMTGFILTFGLIILGRMGNMYMGFTDILTAYAVTALGSVSATALFMIVVLFFKSSSASGAFFGILSAASGFVIGAYIPISQFSEGVQTLCNIFPGSHVTILMRNVLLNGILEHINSQIVIDNGLFVNSIKNIFVFKANMFGNTVDAAGMLVYTVVFFVVSVLAMIYAFEKIVLKSGD